MNDGADADKPAPPHPEVAEPCAGVAAHASAREPAAAAGIETADRAVAPPAAPASPVGRREQRPRAAVVPAAPAWPLRIPTTLALSPPPPRLALPPPSSAPGRSHARCRRRGAARRTCNRARHGRPRARRAGAGVSTACIRRRGPAAIAALGRTTLARPCAARTRRPLLPPARLPACRCRAHGTPIPRGRRAVAPLRRRPREVPGHRSPPLAHPNVVPSLPLRRQPKPMAAASRWWQPRAGSQQPGRRPPRQLRPLAKPAPPPPPPRPDGWRNGGAGAALPGSARAPQGVSTISAAAGSRRKPARGRSTAVAACSL